MASAEVVLASIDHHYTISDRLTPSQLREHQARGSCINCDLRATAEQNPRWVAAGRPMLAGSGAFRYRGGAVTTPGAKPYNGRVAFPGDPDLDCHLTGLRLASVVTVRSQDYDVEAALEFDTSEAAGWWVEDATGQRAVPTQVTSLSATFGVKLPDDMGHVADLILKRLSAWASDGALMAMTSAPGKWTLLYCPGHPAGEQVVYPRGVPPC